MKKSRKLLISLELILFTSLTLVISFAWIPRKWAPEITYDDIHISTSGALIISFTGADGNEQNYTDVIVNDYLDIQQFELRQVSSIDGIKFFTPDFSPMVNNNNIPDPANKKVPVYKDYDVLKDKRFIETKFKIKSTVDVGVQKNVLLHPESLLTLKTKGNATFDSKSDLALRVAIIAGNQAPIIFSNHTTQESADLKAAKANAAGNNIYVKYTDMESNTLNSVCHDTQNVLPFPTKESGPTTLFTLDETGEEDIIVRIWLEGCDPNCVNQIVGDSLNLMLKFDAADVK